MKQNLINICLFALLSLALSQQEETPKNVDVKTRIKTEQIYKTTNIPSNQIYSINVKRVDSSKAEQVSRCWSLPRTIKVTHTQELFRLSKSKENKNRQQKVYEKLTSLTEMENIIEEFQFVGDNIFVITSDGSGYFIPIGDHEKIKKVQTLFFSKKNSYSYDLIVLKEYKENVLIISHDNFVICSFEKCSKVKGFQPVKRFRGAKIYEEKGKYFVFLISNHEIRSYQIDNDQLKDKKVYNKDLFGVDKVHFQGISKVGPSTFYVLDSLQGVWQMIGDSNLSISKGFFGKKKLVFEQFGCYQIVEKEEGKSLILACNPSYNNFFIMNLIKSTQFTDGITYEPLETVFMQDQLYQIEAVQNILMSRVYTGVKLFWSSKQIGNPYPYFYRKAGSIFLHNAIQSKMKVINGKKTIFMAAEDELLKYELKSIDPYVTCYSPIEVNEEYKIQYQVQCQQTFRGKENICTKEQFLNFETWEHKEVRVGSHIMPFLISLGGVVLIGVILFKINKKFKEEVEEKRKTYNIDEDQLSV